MQLSQVLSLSIKTAYLTVSVSHSMSSIITRNVYLITHFLSTPGEFQMN